MKFPHNNDALTGCHFYECVLVQYEAATHDSLAATSLQRPLSFNMDPFMHSLVPLWLLYLSSVLWLLPRPPQLLSPAQAYITQRQIWIQLVQLLSHSTPYSAFIAKADPWATFYLSVSSPLKALADQSNFDKQSFPVWSSEGILKGWHGLRRNTMQSNVLLLQWQKSMT